LLRTPGGLTDQKNRRWFDPHPISPLLLSHGRKIPGSCDDC
jgi:hypothetical protein